MRITFFIPFLMSAFGSALSVSTLEQLSERIHALEQDIKEIHTKLNDISVKLDVLSNHHDQSGEPIAILPKKELMPLYVMLDDPEEATSASVSSFIDYLHNEISGLTTTIIQNINDIPEDGQQTSVIIYLHPIKSDRLEGYYDPNRYRECGEQSAMHCIFTSLRQFQKNRAAPKVKPNVSESKNIRPHVDSLEFRHFLSNFHSSSQDANNKQNLELLERALETKQIS